MSKKFDIYKFYKGEEANPFSYDKQNEAHSFWEYERMFDEQFNEGEFSLESWTIGLDKTATKEWEEVLSQNPVDKEALFKLWLFELLSTHLPDKYESEPDHFIKLYWATTSISM